MLQTPNLGFREGSLSYLGDLMFHKKTAGDIMHKQAHCGDEAANHQPSESSK